jgi:hypothetical protein
MPRITRRIFLCSSAAFPIGCALQRSGSPPAAASVRAPSVGQSWRYAKLNRYSQRVIDNQIDQVANVGSTVHIDSRSEAGVASAQPSWGKRWLSKYVAHDNPLGPLPGEIQQPWGDVVVDPHWAEVQVYETPIPLWPMQLRAGWSSRFYTKYKTPSQDMEYWWDQTMTAHGWETVSVPAGRFTALRYTNLIDFTSTDLTRTSCMRKETLWFAPEVGRWVIRQSGGTYYETNSGDDSVFEESSYQWELVSYT